jgi:hypothetical protein
MRSLILTLIFLIIPISNAQAFSNGDLHKQCRAYAASGFKINSSDAYGCASYVLGVINVANLVCMAALAEAEISRGTSEQKEVWRSAGLKFGSQVENKNLQAVI